MIMCVQKQCTIWKENNDDMNHGFQGYRCIFCGNSDTPQIVKNKTRDSNHKVVRCISCKLQQLYPISTIEEDKVYYDKNPHDKLITPNYSIDDIFDKFYFQNEYRINYMESDIQIKADWEILDLACGYGFLIQMMSERGYKVSGIEISENKLKICRERLKENFNRIFNVNLLEQDVPKQLQGRFDIVTMFHVIEHISKPIEFVNKALKLLKPEGLLLMELPNVSNNMMEASEAFNDFFYIRDHVAYYTPELIAELVEKAGAKVIKQKGVQLYGLENHMNWIINKTPQYQKPSYYSCEAMRWIEDIYKEQLNERIQSEYMYILAEK